jgi:hypothetical protein
MKQATKLKPTVRVRRAHTNGNLSDAVKVSTKPSSEGVCGFLLNVSESCRNTPRQTDANHSRTSKTRIYKKPENASMRLRSKRQSKEVWNETHDGNQAVQAPKYALQTQTTSECSSKPKSESAVEERCLPVTWVMNACTYDTEVEVSRVINHAW